MKNDSCSLEPSAGATAAEATTAAETAEATTEATTEVSTAETAPSVQIPDGSDVWAAEAAGFMVGVAIAVILIVFEGVKDQDYQQDYKWKASEDVNDEA